MPQEPKPSISRYVSRGSAYLERQPLPRVLVAGVVLGLGLGIPGLVYLRSPVWLLLWGVLFVALWRMAHSAEPVFEEDTPVVVETVPKRVRDGPLLMVDLPGGQFRYRPYDAQFVTNPRGQKKPLSDYPRRVVRGGSFDLPPEVLRSAVRVSFRPEDWLGSVGFRCVRVPPAS